MHARILCPFDVDQVLALVESHVREIQPHMLFSESKTRLWLERAAAGQAPAYPMFVVDQGGTIAGYLLASVVDYFYSHANGLNLQAVYVVPRLRGSRAFILLIEQLRALGGRIGAAEINISGLPPTANQARLGRVFHRLGFEAMGLSYRGVAAPAAASQAA